MNRCDRRLTILEQDKTIPHQAISYPMSLLTPARPLHITHSEMEQLQGIKISHRNKEIRRNRTEESRTEQEGSWWRIKTIKTKIRKNRETFKRRTRSDKEELREIGRM